MGVETLTYKRWGVLVINFEIDPKRYQELVLWARLAIFFAPMRYN